MGRLAVFMNDEYRTSLGNVCLGAAGLTFNTTTPVALDTANAVDYTVDGVIHNLAVLSAQAFSAGNTSIGPNEKVFFALVADAAGNVATIQGDTFKTVFQNGTTYYADKNWGVNASQTQTDPYPSNTVLQESTIQFLPGVPVSFTAIGLIKVETDTVTSFVPGITALNATGITATFYDVMTLPARTAL